MNEIEVYYDEAYARQSAAWFWRLIECHDDEAVGPFRTKDEATTHARQNGFRVSEAA